MTDIKDFDKIVSANFREVVAGELLQNGCTAILIL
jgi:hypothetical protein